MKDRLKNSFIMRKKFPNQNKCFDLQQKRSKRDTWLGGMVTQMHKFEKIKAYTETNCRMSGDETVFFI